MTNKLQLIIDIEGIEYNPKMIARELLNKVLKEDNKISKIKVFKLK